MKWESTQLAHRLRAASKRRGSIGIRSGEHLPLGEAIQKYWSSIQLIFPFTESMALPSLSK